MKYSIAWFDLLSVVLVLFGIWRGRKRGMSMEFLDVLKWVAVVAAAGAAARYGAAFVAQTTVFSLLSCHVAVYVGTALLVMVTFGLIHKGVGSKLVGSDFFGRGEYYLGMISGGLRYGCILLVAVSLLNARAYTQQELAASTKYQSDNFGDIRFPTIFELQQDVFQRSYAGRWVQLHLGPALLPPSTLDSKPLNARRSIVRAREREVSDIMKK